MGVDDLEADAQHVAELLRDEGLAPRTWMAAAGDTFAEHDHGYDKVLVCVGGSISFTTPSAGERELGPGDRWELPAGTPHSAVVGAGGVTCVEAPRR